MLGQGHAAIADAQQQNADHRGSRGLARRRPGRSPQSQPAEQQTPGDEESQPRHQQRWPMSHADTDHQIGGTPDHIEGEKGR